MAAGSVGAGLLFQCKPDEKSAAAPDKLSEYNYDRYDAEVEREKKILSETFFNEHEMKTIGRLSDIIIPKDDVSGSATEAGVPDHGFQSWWGLAVPTGTPREVVTRLHGSFNEALRSPAVSGKFGPLGLEVVGNTPEEFRKYILADLPRAERLVRSSGAKLD